MRPGLLVVAGLAAFLIAGYWFVGGSKNRPAPAPLPIERSAAPAAAPEVELVAPTTAPSQATMPAVVPQKAAPPAEPPKPAQKRRSRPETGVDELSENREQAPAIRSQENASADGTIIQGPGIAVQTSSDTLSFADVAQARQRAHLASLSQRTAQNAAAMSAIPAALAPSDFLTADSGERQGEAEAVNRTADGRTILELPPALVGPLSLRLAAAKGDPSAQFEVATRLAEGKGIKQDFGAGCRLVSARGQSRLHLAQYRLAALYERGLGTKLIRACSSLVSRARRARQRQGHAQSGRSECRPRAVEPRLPVAAQWFTEAAERGLADSQYNLGVLHESGLGSPKDPQTAYKWYSLAAARWGQRSGSPPRSLEDPSRGSLHPSCRTVTRELARPSDRAVGQ